MTITYPAVFRQKEDGSYDGYFPDLTGCRFEGKTLDDARNDAIEAEHSWIELEIDEMEGRRFPGSSVREPPRGHRDRRP